MNESSLPLGCKSFSRYLQSLDSVRFNESDKEACISQSKFEVFTALLLGLSIPIGEQQFIDSYGFLTNACDILESKKKLPMNERKKIDNIFPFQLVFREEYKTIDGLIAEKLGNPDYKLSLWNALGKSDNEDMVQKRIKIREKIENGNFQFENDELIPHSDIETAKKLNMVRKMFMEGEIGLSTTIYGEKITNYTHYNGLLEKGIKKITSYTEDDLSYQLELQRRRLESGFATYNLLEPNNVDQAIELINILNNLKDLGLGINNRSSIRIGFIEGNEYSKEKIVKFIDYINNEQKYEGILEVFDFLYNSTLAKSCFAHSESISTARNINENKYVEAALAISTMAKNEITDQAQIKGDYFNPPWLQNLNFSINSSQNTKRLIESVPWEKIWEAYIDPDWQNSVTDLNRVVDKWDSLINTPTTSKNEYWDIKHELSDVYDKHIEIISDKIKNECWNFIKDKKSGDYIIEYTPEFVGISAGVASKMIIGQFDMDIFWEATIPLLSASAARIAAKKLINPIGQWITKGYIRKTFARLVD